MADAATLSSIQVIDTDSHVSEPYDLWTSRVASKYQDRVPVVETYDVTGSKHWRIGDVWLAATGFFAQAGSPDYPPAGNYRNLEDADPGSWNPVERLKRMDEHGVYAQVLYPNIIGFEAPLFIGDHLHPCLQRLSHRVFASRSEAIHPHRDGALLGHRGVVDGDQASAQHWS
jgi:uncharacterized protein